MGMNAHLHFVVSKGLMERLKEEAEERGMNISELCRERLRGRSELKGIEEKLEDIEKTKRRIEVIDEKLVVAREKLERIDKRIKELKRLEG